MVETTDVQRGAGLRTDRQIRELGPTGVSTPRMLLTMRMVTAVWPPMTPGSVRMIPVTFRTGPGNRPLIGSHPLWWSVNSCDRHWPVEVTVGHRDTGVAR
jgi:hypothetical protein